MDKKKPAAKPGAAKTSSAKGKPAAPKGGSAGTAASKGKLSPKGK